MLDTMGEEPEGPLQGLRKTVVVTLQEMLTQMQMEKQGFERSMGFIVVTDVRQGSFDRY